MDYSSAFPPDGFFTLARERPRRASAAGAGRLRCGLLSAFALLAPGLAAEYHRDILGDVLAAKLEISHPDECIYNVKNSWNNLYLAANMDVVDNHVVNTDRQVHFGTDPDRDESKWTLQRVGGTDDHLLIPLMRSDHVLYITVGDNGLAHFELCNNWGDASGGHQCDSPGRTESKWVFYEQGNSYIVKAASMDKYICAGGDALESKLKPCEDTKHAWVLEPVGKCPADAAPHGTELETSPQVRPCVYEFRHADSGLYLNVAAGHAQVEQNVQLWDTQSEDSQWVVKRVSETNNRYILETKKAPGIVLNIVAGGYHWTSAQLYNNPDSTDSEWLFYWTEFQRGLIKSANGPWFLGSTGRHNGANVEVIYDVNSSEPSLDVQWETVFVGHCA